MKKDCIVKTKTVIGTRFFFLMKLFFWAPVYSTRDRTTAKKTFNGEYLGIFLKNGFRNLHLFTGSLDAKKMTKIFGKVSL